ncbi:hypothetical protein FBY54_1155 [Zymomonas mobilis]|uniref:EamA-like transporter family protein n=2 Tax=Zymomonas mobilis TaxID=542 RepID=A0A0H3FWB7_ZYMMA|nr:conserved hypothetical protein [Zymomonas mobilis subsp. mobilis ATCC 10988]TQL28360.1 hypothetical protein FBY55_1721 [Zymomonas mobilis]TQL30296.1 hypothetical protein FBY54_1155 [Zymomonas mobilis]
MNQLAYFGIAFFAMLLNTALSLVLGQAFYHTAFASVMAIGYGLATCFLIIVQGHPPAISAKKWLWAIAIASLQSASFYLEMAGLLKIGAQQTATIMALVVVMALLLQYRKKIFSRSGAIALISASFAFGALAILAQPSWPKSWNNGYLFAFMAAFAFAAFFFGNHYVLKKRIIDPVSLAVIGLLTQTVWITPAALFLTRPLPLDFHSGIFLGLIVLAILMAAAQLCLNKAQQAMSAFPMALIFSIEPFASRFFLWMKGHPFPPSFAWAAGLLVVALFLGQPWVMKGRKPALFPLIPKK